MTRTATSPRFATRTRKNMTRWRRRTPEDRLQLEEQLTELDRLRVAHVDGAHDRVHVGLDRLHQLHRLEDAESLPDWTVSPSAHEGPLPAPARGRTSPPSAPRRGRPSCSGAGRRASSGSAAASVGAAAGADSSLRRTDTRIRPPDRHLATPDSGRRARLADPLRPARSIPPPASASSPVARPRIVRRRGSASSPKSASRTSSSSLEASPSASSRSSSSLANGSSAVASPEISSMARGRLRRAAAGGVPYRPATSARAIR